MIPASERHAASTVQSAPAGVLAAEAPAEHQVAVLSAALLHAVMNTYGDDPEGFAARAGVAAEVVAAAAAGTGPAWALPYDEFTAIADAVAALWPCAALETAAACDLLLSCVLDGNQFLATDVLTEPCSQDLAWTLLRLAITSEPANGNGKARNAMLPEDQLALLSERAARLADSESPDAWVGMEILVGCLGRQS
jgi:hypothetical protein